MLLRIYFYSLRPGTKFMSNLANALKYFIEYKINTDVSWKKIKVILSDASVSGEGEHKIGIHFI
jgi:5'-3' exoribonuclease 2